MNALENLLGKVLDLNKRKLNKMWPLVEKVNSLEEEVQSWPDEKFKKKTEEFKDKIQSSENPHETADELLPLAFAMVREAAVRTIGLRHYDVQILAGIAGHQGKVFEQKTGEGKTLTSTLPLYLNALFGKGVHLITVNDFLTKRDAGWNGPIFELLGLSVGAIVHQKAFIYDIEHKDESAIDMRMYHLKPVSRKKAYQADVTYGTNNEFGFDFLRDNMKKDLKELVQREHFYAIIDEVDSVLIDEARTPLIISSPAKEAVDKYYEFANLAKKLTPETDYEVDEKQKTANLTEIGIRKVERWLGVDNLYEKNFEALHHIENALKARTIFQKDRDYVVRDGELIIVDEFTGRLMFGRRYSEGLHQALEAKEDLQIKRESKTLASITIQNYFRMYEKLSGMTGTAATEAEEFYKIYGLDTVVIPTNKPVIRKDHSDVIYKTEAAKYRAVAKEIEEKHQEGQPVLVGTTSIEKNELLDELLTRKGIPHEVLNAKNHEKEAQIISKAGRVSQVTLATNIAGRGVDIELGGERPKKYEGEKWDEERKKKWQKEHEKVLELGGLHVIGTERHESRRIDNQLRGRSGRQGDPGSSRFFVSLQDDLMRIFGGEKISSILDTLKVDENTPIESGMVSRTIESSQKKVEEHNFDIRRRLVEYDDVNNKQRELVYVMRRKILEALQDTEEIDEKDEEFKKWMVEKVKPHDEEIEKKWKEKAEALGENLFYKIVQQITLETIDVLWMEHIDTLKDLRQDLQLMSIGQRDPLVEYKKEARRMFELLINNIFATVADRIEKLDVDVENVEVSSGPQKLTFSHPTANLGLEAEQRGRGKKKKKTKPITTKEKPGRNDPCWCGSGKKYKKCHYPEEPPKA